METFQLKKDVVLFGVQANSFPGGVQQAWQALYKLSPTTTTRNFYGISHGSKDGSIVYRVCVEEVFPGEAESLGCERFVLPQGEYIGETVQNFMQQIEKIGEAFQTLLARNDYDRAGSCVERYLNANDVVCMIKKATVSL